jgi:hypothetical protein
MATFLLASPVPQVEAPFPEKVGLGFPLSMAGAAGVLAGIVYTASPPEKRDRAIAMGSLIGFGIGAVVYLLAFIVQVGSRL